MAKRAYACGMVMRIVLCVSVLIGSMVALYAPPAHAADPASIWRNLSWFEGFWTGRERGLPGDGRARRCYAPIMDGRFLYARSETRFPPQTRNPDGENHAEWQIFSRDHDGGRVLLRRFGSGGQVTRFVLDPEASRSDRYVFISATFDQAPADAHGRLTLTITGSDGFRERLELGAGPDELRQVMEGRWRRAAHEATGCTPEPMEP
ncbi:MAG: hypothetical protein EA417_15520 [Gammaproteobacteria bacterium]|nr:MAG: hypothetical protein EA417_15520 [Gammaproteobacteria bacterium]